MARRAFYYFDHAATTPLREEAFRAMRPYFSKKYGNPSNLYVLGREGRRAIDASAEIIAKSIGASRDEIVFTASATESDNLAVAGTARFYRSEGTKIVISSVEHKAVDAMCTALRKEGFDVCELPVGKDGRVRSKDLAEVLDAKTTLVSIVMADSETGTLQQIKELGKVIQKYRVKHKTSLPRFHTDATQAALYEPIMVDELGVDLLTLSSHKMYGPKGVAALYMRKGIHLAPIIYGGGQGRGVRAGTENVSGIVGFGIAVECLLKEKKREAKRLANLRDMLEQGILKAIPRVRVNGNPKFRLPNFSNISILDIEGEALLLHLDAKGIVINTGSACNSINLEPSHILAAHGLPYEHIHGSIRFTLGRSTTREMVRAVLRELPPIVHALRSASPLHLGINDHGELAEPRAFLRTVKPHFLRKKK